MSEIELENGILTVPVNIKSQEFKDFQLLIEAKSKAMTKEEKVSIALYGLKFEMEDYMLSKSKTIVEVGIYLKKALLVSGIRQNKFAEYIDIKPSNLSKLFSGQRKISIDQALIFESIFGVEANYWLSIQMRNELKKVSKTLRKRFTKYKITELI